MPKFAKSVSFNTKNGDDNTILEHVKKRNFSGYVKRLILEDIKTGATEKAHTSDCEPIQKVLTAKEKLQQLKNKSNRLN